SWGLGINGITWATVFLDFDGDGRDDVYFMDDGAGKANHAFRALGPGPDGEPRFEALHPVPLACDRDGLFDFGDATPMGIALGDLDGAGALEAYIAMTAVDKVLAPQGRGAWLDVRPL